MSICTTCGAIMSEDEGNVKDHNELAHSIDAFISKRDENADIADELPE